MALKSDSPKKTQQDFISSLKKAKLIGIFSKLKIQNWLNLIASV
jgi:hypothetical protein